MRCFDATNPEHDWDELSLPPGVGNGMDGYSDYAADYTYNLKVLEKVDRDFGEVASETRLEDHLRTCWGIAEALHDSSSVLDERDLADYWRAAAGHYENELRSEEILARPPRNPDAPRVMKALRFSPEVYAEAKRVAQEVLHTTLTAYIEEAIREKNYRTTRDPELHAELERRRAFDEARRSRTPPPAIRPPRTPRPD